MDERPGHSSQAKAGSAATMAARISSIRAATGARADATSTGAERERGARLAIAIAANAALSPAATPAVPTHRLDASSLRTGSPQARLRQRNPEQRRGTMCSV